MAEPENGTPSSTLAPEPDAAPLPSPPLRAWYRPGIADAIFLVTSLAILLNSWKGTLDDPGLGWHLRAVDLILEKGDWQVVDAFSGPRHGQPWWTYMWLGEIPYWLANHWGGLNGIAVLTVLVLALAFRQLFSMLVADGIPWPVAAFWTALAAAAGYQAWLARPNVFNLLFVLWTARLCEQFHVGNCSRRRMLLLLPLFAVWVNVHGGFLAGLSIPVGTCLIEGVLGVFHPDADARLQARRRCGFLALLSGGCFLATLANPYGWRLYPWILALVGDDFFLNLHFEWMSPDFHAPGARKFELAMLLFPALLGVTRYRPNLVILGLSVVWLHQSFQSLRFVPLWLMIVTPLLARASVAIPWVEALVRRMDLSADIKTLLGPRPAVSAGLPSALIALALIGWARWGPAYAAHRPDMTPAAALDRLIELHDGQTQIYHDYRWGGYLTWHGWPRVLNWIDDRIELQGRDHIEEHLAIFNAGPGWEQKLKARGIGLVCVPPAAPLAEALKGKPEWEEAYRDEFAVILRKRRDLR